MNGDKTGSLVMDSHLMRFMLPFLEMWKLPFRFVLSTSALAIGVIFSISIGNVIELRHEYQKKKNLLGFVMDSHLKQFIFACLELWKSAFQLVVSASFLGVGVLCSISIGNIIELRHDYQKKNNRYISCNKSQSSNDNIEYKIEKNVTSGGRCAIVGKDRDFKSHQINEISRVSTNSSSSRLHSYTPCTIQT